jgi:hypothetical protein
VVSEPLVNSLRESASWTSPGFVDITVSTEPGELHLRRAGRMHHLGIGTTHARKRVLAFADDHHITVADITTGEVLSRHLIDPNKTYWRNETREPGRWPSSQN